MKWALVLSALLSTAAAAADPLVVYDVIGWREVRSANSIGAVPGDFIKAGILHVTPNPWSGVGGDATVVRMTAPNGNISTLPFVYSPASPDEYSRSNIPFSVGGTVPRRLEVGNPGSSNSPIVVWTPEIKRADGTIPGTQAWVQDMSISGSGTDVTFHFTPPPDSRHDSIGLRIWDRNLLNPAGFPTVIYISPALPASATSHKPPAVLNPDGGTLEVGGQYTVDIQLRENRTTPGLHPVLSRSVSYFNFSPLGPGAPPKAFLPIVGPDNVYHFSVTVQAGQKVFIDPDVAVGYEYATGTGDPDFESIELPTVGDDQFNLEVFDGTSWESRGVIGAGVPYFFGGGVSRFRVTGIEPSARLDPTDPTAFVSGLTFVADGRFTGTMTPITVTLPDDTTPPVITPSISGTLGAEGWYTGPVTVTWDVVDGESVIASPPCPPATLDADTSGTIVSCSATSAGGSASSEVTIRIDTTPPALACTASPNVLWPPNGKMVDVSVTVEGSDAGSGLRPFSLIGLTKSDSDSGKDGTDSLGWTLGAADVNGQLRAARPSSGPGRVYTLTYQAGDAAGNAATCSATVIVPHDQRK